MAWIVWRGRWASLRWRDPVTGLERSRALRTDSPDIAEAERRAAERDLEGTAPSGPVATFAEWKADLLSRGIRSSTVSMYDYKAGALAREWDGRPLSTWSAATIDAWVRARPGLKGQTRRAYLVAIGQFLKWCVVNRRGVSQAVLDELAKTKRPAGRAREPVPLTPAQVAALLRASVGTDIEPAVALAALCGLSRVDIKTLRWDEVDLRAGTIVRRMGRHKTGERLEVAIPAAVVEVLTRHRHAGPLVCRLPGLATMRLRLVGLFDAAAVPREKGDGWHRLRHSLGTMMAAAGADVSTIGAALGHAPGSPITLRYMHPERHRTKAAIDAVAAAVAKAGTPAKSASTG